MELGSFFIHLFHIFLIITSPYFFNFFWVNKNQRFFQTKKSQVALAMASPSHCCVSSLVTSLTAWECALGQHSQLGRRTSLHQWLARNHVAVWYDVGLESLLSFFFLGGLTVQKSTRSQEISRDICCFFLLKFGSLVVKWSDVIVGRCFTSNQLGGVLWTVIFFSHCSWCYDGEVRS